MKKFLRPKKYKEVLGLMPIPCVDIIIRFKGKLLLVKRNREPMSGEWWPIGGRILRGESLEETAKRLLRKEIGLRGGKFKIIGYYNEVFKTSYFNVPIHTLGITLEMEVNSLDGLKIDETSADWGLFNSLPKRFLQNWTRI